MELPSLRLGVAKAVFGGRFIYMVNFAVRVNLMFYLKFVCYIGFLC